MTDVEAAYLAGAIDRKCQVNLYRSREYYSIYFHLVYTDVKSAIHIARLIDATIRHDKSPFSVSLKPIWVIRLRQQRKVRDVLEAALPFLQGQKEKVSMIVDYLNSRLINRGSPMTTKEITLAEEIIRRYK